MQVIQLFCGLRIFPNGCQDSDSLPAPMPAVSLKAGTSQVKLLQFLLPLKIFILCSLFFLVLAGQVVAVDEWKGTRCGIKVATQVVVTTQEEWENLWKEMGMTSALPKINFRRRVVVGIFSGEKPTAGFSMEIKEVKERTKRVTVYFKEQGPLPIQMVAQVLTQPYILRVIQRPGKHKRIVFEQL